MSGGRISRQIYIEAPVEVVWAAVTEPDSIRQWFADRVDLQAVAGHQGTLTFQDGPGGPRRTINVSVQVVQPPRLFAFRWEHPAGAVAGPGNSTLVEFTLIPTGSGTTLRVEESGVEAMVWPPADRDGFTQDHRAGWAHYLARLHRTVTGHPSNRTP